MAFQYIYLPTLCEDLFIKFVYNTLLLSTQCRLHNSTVRTWRKLLRAGYALIFWKNVNGCLLRPTQVSCSAVSEAAGVRIPDYLKLALYCKCNPQTANVNLIRLFFLWRSSLNLKQTIVRYPMKAVSRGMKERVELNRYLRHRRQPQKKCFCAISC